MRIPKRFKLLGQTIEVIFDPEIIHNEDARGLAKYRTNRIVLQPKSKYTPVPIESIEQTFLHELIHFILYFARDEKHDPPLFEQEILVDRVAGLLHQALKTMEYK